MADLSTDDKWYLDNSALMTATPNARPINVSLDNGVGHRERPRRRVVYTLSEKLNGGNDALLPSDEWKASGQLTVDAGVRYERRRIDGTINNPISNDLDNNPPTIYNNNASVASNNNTLVDRKDHQFLHFRRAVQGGQGVQRVRTDEKNPRP